jgi:deoxyribodipyrimidine photo-lyase
MEINIVWFRRDLRLDDNNALNAALSSGLPVLPLFIFDQDITEELPDDDPRIGFIYDMLSSMNNTLLKYGSSFCILRGNIEPLWKKLIESYEINAVYINKDYEPYGIQRDTKIEILLRAHGITLLKFKDQVIFEEREIMKQDKNPYTVYTPYKNRWLQEFTFQLPNVSQAIKNIPAGYYQHLFPFPALDRIGFRESSIKVRPYDLSCIGDYEKHRDIPSADSTSYLSPHLRFGTISIRSLVKIAFGTNLVFLSELIWREFFMQILWHFPHVETTSFRKQYDSIDWINNEEHFKRWCNGETGFPIVDAGMRELKETGYMHNRVRMIAANFLTRHLLTDWRWGEAWFASRLLDYELSSNNGNWQWAAGTGCDAAPYFRIFNPETQAEKFDPGLKYIRKWVPEYGTPRYPHPLTDHKTARERALKHYRDGIRII